MRRFGPFCRKNTSSAPVVTRPIYLHAGAHRTGTSSFQLCLVENADYLGAQGYAVAHPGRDRVPGGNLKLRLPAPRHAAGDRSKFVNVARQTLHEASPDPDRPLIMSEENIAGRMMHFEYGRFYPSSYERFQTLREAIEDAPLDVLLVVRSYAQLFLSAYRKRAEGVKVNPFSVLKPKLMQMDRGWPEIVAQAQEVLRPRRFVVIDYKNRGSSCDLLGHLVPGLEAERLVEPSKTLNPSATDAALDALQARYRAGESLLPRDIDAVAAEHAENRDSTGFAEFSGAQYAKLNRRYARDLDRIRALPEITVI